MIIILLGDEFMKTNKQSSTNKITNRNNSKICDSNKRISNSGNSKNISNKKEVGFTTDELNSNNNNYDEQ